MRRTLLALCLTIAAATPLLAHHGWGSYDAQNPVTASGPIRKVEFANPHVSIDLEVKDKTWEVILAPPSRMELRGATREVVSAGKVVTAYGYPSRNNPNEMRAEWIEVDGARYRLR